MKLPRLVNRGTRRWLVGAVVVVLLAGSTAAWAATRNAGAATSTTVLATATSSTIRQTVSATGTLVPARQADLSFTVSGTVSSVRVSVGDHVRKGQALATVGSSALRADLAAARAGVTAAASQLSSDQAAAASAAQLTSDEASLQSAKSARAGARVALRNATLRSTVRGTVAALDLTVGAQVGGSSGGNGAQDSSAAASSAQVTVISTDAFDVDASVGSSDLASLKQGMQAEITPSGTTQTLFGTVSSVGLVAESSTSGSSTFPVTIAVTGNVAGVYAGSSADVSIIVKQVPNVLSVPTAAVSSAGGKTTVTVSTNGKQVVTPVTIGQVYGAQTEITKGLKAGQQVVVTTLRFPTGTGTAGTNRQRGTGTFPGGGFGGGPPGVAPGGGPVTVEGGG
ncbi:MAG: hypothetical protein QOD68_1666 [Actinomycetota bacterium]|nr:hypothetical protein [Actinomycetota bacterium]